MEQEVQKREQQEEVEQQEEEESSVLVRKPRNENGSKTTKIAAADVEEVSEGVSDCNGHSEFAANGAKHEESIVEEQNTEELDGVLENESEAINGEQKLEHLIFYDETEGIWKCRLCSWTYQNGNLCVDHIENHEGLLHELMNVETINSESEDNKSCKEIGSIEVDAEDLEGAEFDVERVIQKQTTHELYCPNCNSCITKRVILRKRKRRNRISDDEVKRNKVEEKFNLGTGSVQSTNDQIHCEDEVGDGDTQPPTANEDEHDRGPDIFRCLSCFSLFIPTRNGFKLFRIFQNKRKNENVPDEQAPTVPSYKPETEHDQGKDTVIDIDKQPVGSDQPPQDTIGPPEPTASVQPGTEISIADQERAEAREQFKIEVIKSAVYGGLTESITSLSVISSAAGGGAATLNTLAVGVANLVGGFFVICHSLWELRSNHLEQVADRSHAQPEQRDRYRELLGRRQHFILHFVAAIISYLVFGSVPPVVYGISFYKTDDKQLKLIVTAAASLLCIFVLSIGSAYIRTPPKPYMKIILRNIGLGIMVSGVTYAGGELVERFLEKLGFSQPSSVSSLLLDEMITTASQRASY